MTGCFCPSQISIHDGLQLLVQRGGWEGLVQVGQLLDFEADPCIRLGFLVLTETRIELILSRTGPRLIFELRCELNGRPRKLRRKCALGLVVAVTVHGASLKRTPLRLRAYLRMLRKGQQGHVCRE